MLFFLPFYPFFAVLASGPPGWAFSLLEGRSYSWKRKVQGVGWSEKMVRGAAPWQGWPGCVVGLQCSVGWVSLLRQTCAVMSQERHTCFTDSGPPHLPSWRRSLLPAPGWHESIGCPWLWGAILLCSSRIPNMKLHLHLPALPCFVQTQILGTNRRKSVGGSSFDRCVHLLEVCAVPNSQPLRCAELETSREPRMHVFSETGRAGSGGDKSNICLIE